MSGRAETSSQSKTVRSEQYGCRAVVLAVLLALVALFPLVASIPNGLSAGSASRSRERSSRNQMTSSQRFSASSSNDYADQPSQGQRHFQNFDDSNDDYYNSDADEETSNLDEENSDNGIDDSIDGRGSPDNCTHCMARLGKRDYRLESIKAEILRKLRLTQPPNVTTLRLPEIPYIKRMVDEWNYQSDAPMNERDLDITDDYHATTMKLLLFPIPGKDQK